MMRNLVLVFAAIFTVTTALDLATTWILLPMGYPETNPYTDTSSLEAMARPEILTLFIGMFLVGWGAHINKATLLEISNKEFSVFWKTFCSNKQAFRTFLILLPMILATLRSVPVISNAMIGLTGYGLFVDEEFSLLSRNQVILAVCGVLFVRPNVYLIYRVCRASTS